MNIIGWDSETFNGYVKVLANSQGQFIESSNTKELLDFLMLNSNADYNVFFNINYDLGSILKDYLTINGHQIRTELYKSMNIKRLGLTDNDVGYTFNIGSYHIKYLSDKMFELQKDKELRSFWDASNFYKSGYGHLSLDIASKLYLNDKKNAEELNLDRAKIGSEDGYYKAHRDNIITYCIKDADLTAHLFERTIKAYENINLVFPKKPYSEASIFKEYIKPLWGKEEIWSKYYQSIKESIYFRNAYKGGIFITKKIGHYNNVIDIDINSAYPYAMSRLYSIVGSEIVNYSSDYTFYKIKACPQEFLPIKIDNRLYYGNSRFKQTFYITEFDKKVLDLYNYPYEIENIVGIKTNHIKLSIDIDRWFKIKNEIKQKYSKNSVEYLNIKIFLNSGYGVLAQSYPALTKFTNFIYASYITAYTRWYILSLIRDYQDKVISISTDGVLMLRDDKFLNTIKNKISDKFGQLSLEEYNSVTQYGNGIYLLMTKDGQYILRKRGYESMKYEDLFQPVYKIEYKAPKPMRMIEAIIQKKYNEINAFTVQNKIFSPYNIWINSNPEFSESIKDIAINEFHNIQLNVEPLNLDKYKWYVNIKSDK